jgi:hypothetical protein
VRLPPLALVSLALLAGTTASAQQGWRWDKAQRKRLETLVKEVAKGDAFPYVLEGDHWRVETEISAAFTAELSVFMDAFFESFDELLAGLDAKAQVDRKPTVQVFASNGAYAAAGHNAANRGYYTYKWDGAGAFTSLHLHTFVKADSEREFSRFYHPILLHEGTHVLLRRLFGKVAAPKWFDEGIAAWFQFYDLRASVKANRKTRYRRSFYLTKGHLKRAVQKGPTLAALMALTDKTWDPDSMGPLASEHYALGESLIDLMLSNKKGAQAFKLVFARVLAEESPALPEAEAEALEPRWRRHLGRLTGR